MHLSCIEVRWLCVNILARRPIDPRNRFTVAMKVFFNVYKSSEKIRQPDGLNWAASCSLVSYVRA